MPAGNANERALEDSGETSQTDSELQTTTADGVVRQHALEADWTCPDCNSRLYPDGVDAVCESCGSVFQRPGHRGGAIDPHFQSPHPSRDVGEPARQGTDSYNLRTSFQIAESDQSGEVQHQFRRNCARQQYTGGTREVNLRHARAQFAMICDDLQLRGAAAERGRQVYGDAYEAGVVTGDSIERLVASSLLLAIREQNLPYSARDIGDCIDLSKDRIVKGVLKLCQELDIEYQLASDPDVFFPRLVSAVGLPPAMVQACEEFYAAIDTDAFTDGSPTITAGAIIYTVAAMSPEYDMVSQATIAEAALCSEKAIRERFKKLRTTYDLEFPSAIKKKAHQPPGPQ